MRFDAFFRILFILYCLEAGLFLLAAPWSPFWEKVVLPVPPGFLQVLLLHPMLRGAVTGFGLVHLVWGLHDLTSLFQPRQGHRVYR